MKNISELMVHGYDGEELLFMARLVPDKATILPSSTFADSDTALDNIEQHAADVVTAIRDMLDGRTPVRA